jgi:alpha-1,3-rhamnosyl/mannosyltransferase
VRVYVDLPAASGATGTGVYGYELVRHLPAGMVVRDGYDVFHRPSQIYDVAALDRFLREKKRVLTYLDLISYRTPTLFASREAHERYCQFSRAALEAADAVIAISEYGRREILDEFGVEAHAIPLGVDADFFARPAPVRPWPRPYFLCVSSDYPHKNLALLLRTYAWLRPEADLLFTGHRTKTPGIYELGPDPAPGVHYLGEVDRSKLPALYQHAEAFIYPSTYEGFGLPVLEAMAAGTPVICARLTSVPEVAGDAALYLDELSMDELADRMRSVSAMRDRLVAAGRERVKRFTWQQTAAKTVEIYRRTARG